MDSRRGASRPVAVVLAERPESSAALPVCYTVGTVAETDKGGLVDKRGKFKTQSGGFGSVRRP